MGLLSMSTQSFSCKKKKGFRKIHDTRDETKEILSVLPHTKGNCKEMVEQFPVFSKGSFQNLQKFQSKHGRMIFQKNQILWVRCCSSFQAPQHIADVISVSYPLFMMKNVNSMLSIFVCCLAIFFVSYTHQNISGQIMYSIKGQS